MVSPSYGLRPELMREKVLFTWLPRKDRIRITTIAMSTRIRAYSTRPWPFFFNCSILARIVFFSIDDNCLDKLLWRSWHYNFPRAGLPVHLTAQPSNHE